MRPALGGMSVLQGDFTDDTGLNPNVPSRLLGLVGFVHVKSCETGPISLGHGLRSESAILAAPRFRVGLVLWNLPEAGGAASEVLARGFFDYGGEVH